MTDAEFRILWVAGYSAAAIAQATRCAVSAVNARAQYLGFITPILPEGAEVPARDTHSLIDLHEIKWLVISPDTRSECLSRDDFTPPNGAMHTD